jgi:translation initiation factor 2A
VGIDKNQAGLSVSSTGGQVLFQVAQADPSQEVKLFKFGPVTPTGSSKLGLLMKDHLKILAVQESAEDDPRAEIKELPLNIKGAFLDFEFSPSGDLLITFERYSKSPDQPEPPKNVKLWSLLSSATTPTLVYECTQKSLSSWGLQWVFSPSSSNSAKKESLFAHSATNEIQFFQLSSSSLIKGNLASPHFVLNSNIHPSKLTAPDYRLRVENVSSFSISPLSGSNQQTCAVFIPEKKGAPACIQLYKLSFSPSATSTSQENSTFSLVTKKSFYRADSVQFLWNAMGTNLLAYTHTDVDKTGQSYYGETNLYYLSANGSFDCRIDLGKFRSERRPCGPNRAKRNK